MTAYEIDLQPFVPRSSPTAPDSALWAFWSNQGLEYHAQDFQRKPIYSAEPVLSTVEDIEHVFQSVAVTHLVRNHHDETKVQSMIAKLLARLFSCSETLSPKGSQQSIFDPRIESGSLVKLPAATIGQRREPLAQLR